MFQFGIAQWQRTATSLEGAFLIDTGVFADHRGFILESYHQDALAGLGIHDTFVQENLSYSNRHALRGLHFQAGRPQARLGRAVGGEILSVAVDVRRGSPSFGRTLAVVLSAHNRRMLYVPAGVATGTLTLSDSACYLYHSSRYYAPDLQRGIHWKDAALALDWPVADPLVSEKDRNLPCLADLPVDDLPVYRP